ncbi:putative type IX secretion system sortase PorU2 [Hymenobacter mucosus]|uniref:Peptidase family C25 n=1 Tax=Hymenobacter mucosus TaxID=1411120 RepID=A0A238XU45_9BACT|nr:C25 family cysteine peptidase [Hymenobacter mucosus]SNR61529.1 Peptidase family C25 [Hymenobacter mucosus]
MKQPYTLLTQLRYRWLLLVVLLWSGLARAQSGPYGNEWIVPSQQYYKIKLAQDGLYRLDYQYLTRAGISGVNPQRLQLWRRGREVAIHVGGNQTSLDATTFIEFIGQRNDGLLDRGMYKNATDQAHPFYSLYTDTASYFLTWSATDNGRRMAASNLAGTGTPHAIRMKPEMRVLGEWYTDIQLSAFVFQPWAEPNEGFLSAHISPNSSRDFPVNLVQSVAAQGQEPQVELLIAGATTATHAGVVYALNASGAQRQLGTFQIAGVGKVKGRYILQRNEITGGTARIRVALNPVTGNPNPAPLIRLGYVRLVYPQTNRWFAGTSRLYFANDSTQAGSAYYQLDSLPATVRGYDITDPYAVQRIEGTAGIGQQRSYVFPNANGRTRALLLADAATPLVPGVARRVQFRQITPSAHNYLIVSHKLLMKPVGNVANPVRAYADYRASTTGGRYDTLVVTSDQLYDQFHYGEKSPLAIRQFAQWMLAGSTREKSLFLLGKGLVIGEYDCGTYHRHNPKQYSRCRITATDTASSLDLVPMSTRGASDIFFTANWQNNNYVAQMATGRVVAKNSLEVMAYLNKIIEHEAGGLESWRRNAIHMAGGQDTLDYRDFNAKVDEYSAIIRRPPFAANAVRTYRRSDYPGTGTPHPLNIAAELNSGVSIISYFGHGDPERLDFDLARIDVASSGYANKGKYPMMYVSGCAAGNAFRAIRSFGERFILAPDKGFLGFLSESSFGFPEDLHEMHTQMYTLLFNDPEWYGKPVAAVQNEVSRRLQPSYASSQAAVATLMNTVWQGDPAFRLFAPLKPDFQTNNASLLLPTNIPLNAAAVDLRVTVRNPGRTTTGQLQVRVTRRIGSQTFPTLVSVRQARRDTTYIISLNNLNLGDVSGLNTFVVDLDPNNVIDELDETNNQGTITYTFLQGGVTTLSPPEFGIVGTTSVRLVGQNNIATTTSREYAFELDTVQTFTSDLVRRTTVNAVMVPEWSVTLPVVANPDSVVWYWRVKLAAPQTGESADWATSSFRVLNGRTTGGWSQSHVGQFLRDEQAGVSVAAPGGKWSFDAGSQQGNITSTRIGPAVQWETLYHTIRAGSSGSYTLQLTGIDTLGNSVVLNPSVTSRALSLSTISAKQYPYLELRAIVRGTGSSPAPQLEQWLVTYEGVPEGVVRPSATPLTAATLRQQAQQTGKITVPVTFQNVADFAFKAPLKAYIVVRTDNSTTTPREKYYNLTGPALAAHSQRTYQVELDVRDLSGTLSGQVVLNPRRQPELYYFNNEQALPPFQVASQDTPPVLDVAFDGRHLLNGDIVSAQPLITVQLRDQDRLRPIKDRTAFSLFLSSPNSTTTTALNLNAANVVFAADSAQGVARLEIQLGKDTKLADGVYVLEVQGKDGAGNLAGAEPYRITFEVISESGITNVYPYPNPITSKAKFVFTLTGNELPRNMKIQIMTLTGRVVREIMMSELGNLRIGNNITDYAWDGTDTYGDRLANGTYLYRVILDDAEGTFKHRDTAGDKAFKKGWGKLVLLR